MYTTIVEHLPDKHSSRPCLLATAANPTSSHLVLARGTGRYTLASEPLPLAGARSVTVSLRLGTNSFHPGSWSVGILFDADPTCGVACSITISPGTTGITAFGSVLLQDADEEYLPHTSETHEIRLTVLSPTAQHNGQAYIEMSTATKPVRVAVKEPLWEYIAHSHVGVTIDFGKGWCVAVRGG